MKLFCIRKKKKEKREEKEEETDCLFYMPRAQLRKDNLKVKHLLLTRSFQYIYEPPPSLLQTLLPITDMCVRV